MSFESLNDDHQPSSPEIFLDTSIHCSKLKGSLFKERIDRVLRLFRWKTTSSYAKVEFGNVVLAQAEYYVRKLDEFGSLEKTKDFIGNVLPHSLHRAKVLWSFNLLNAYGESDSECTERARRSLRTLMRLGVKFVERQCDSPIEDGTGCYWAAVGVKKMRDGRLKWETPVCERHRKRCRLDDFFSENRETFKKIKAAIDAMPADKRSDQLAGFSDVIGKALEDPACLLDYKTGCRRLADAIIAVDSQRCKNLFSQNSQESELLSQVLNQTFYFLPPNPEKGVLVRLPIVEPPPLQG